MTPIYGDPTEELRHHLARALSQIEALEQHNAELRHELVVARADLRDLHSAVAESVVERLREVSRD